VQHVQIQRLRNFVLEVVLKSNLIMQSESILEPLHEIIKKDETLLITSDIPVPDAGETRVG